MLIGPGSARDEIKKLVISLSATQTVVKELGQTMVRAQADVDQWRRKLGVLGVYSLGLFGKRRTYREYRAVLDHQRGIVKSYQEKLESTEVLQQKIDQALESALRHNQDFNQLMQKLELVKSLQIEVDQELKLIAEFRGCLVSNLPVGMPEGWLHELSCQQSNVQTALQLTVEQLQPPVSTSLKATWTMLKRNTALSDDATVVENLEILRLLKRQVEVLRNKTKAVIAYLQEERQQQLDAAYKELAEE